MLRLILFSFCHLQAYIQKFVKNSKCLSETWKCVDYTFILELIINWMVLNELGKLCKLSNSSSMSEQCISLECGVALPEFADEGVLVEAAFVWGWCGG